MATTKKEGCWGFRGWGWGKNGTLKVVPDRSKGKSPRQIRDENNGFRKD